MKHISIFLIFILFGLMFVGNINVFAMGTSGFLTEEMSREEIEVFLSNVNITMFYSEPDQEPIKCFDVGLNEMIAIGTEDSSNKKVSIYSGDGTFQYGYSFKTEGSFGVELDNELLNIYFVRSDVSVSVNSAGEIENISRISNSEINNTYWNQSVEASSRCVGEYRYVLKNDIGFLAIFTSTYSQLYKMDSLGNEVLIYDANSYQFIHILFAFIGIATFVIVVFVVIIKEFKRLQREKV